MKFWFICDIFYLVSLLCVTADWPVPKSIKCKSTGTFHCKRTGIYEDPFDYTCTKYFLCNEFTYETIKVELTCPENTFFDPVNQHCSAQYACICNEDTTSTPPEPTLKSSTFKAETPLPYPDDCQICSQCITSVGSKPTSTTTEKAIWTTQFSETSTSDITVTEDTPVTTRETTPGHFETTVSSSNNTLTTHLSETTYSEYENTFSPTSIATIFTLLPTTRQPVRPSSPFPTSTHAISTTEYNPTTSITSKYCNVGGNVTCTQTGRFANPDDPSCNSYFYCYVWSNGTVRQYLYSCSIGVFNPITGACDLSYSCPCTEATTNENTSVFTTTQHAFSSSSQFTLPSNTVFTTQSATITPATPNNCDLGENFTCAETGRFANPDDRSCNSYFYCYVWSNGTVGQYLYSCSIGTFNPSKGACDLSYSCPCTEVTTNDNTSIFTRTQQPLSSSSQSSSAMHSASTAESIPVTPTTQKYCNLGGNFTCSKTGRFANPDDPSCNSYFYCYVWSNGIVGQYLYSCSLGLFNPDKGACDLAYACPCAANPTTENTSIFTSTQQPPSSSSQSSSSILPISTTESTTLTPATQKYCNIGGNFTCTKTGRFSNPDDPSCNSYFYCYVWSNGTIGRYWYSCSVGLFNPNKGACDLSYACPCTEIITTSSAFTTAQQQPSSSNDPPQSTNTVSTTESTTITSANPKYCNIGGNFTCTKTGRFANPDDPSCNSYFYCYVWSNGKVGQHLYSCSVGLFNPSKAACDTHYICPCAETSVVLSNTSTSSLRSDTSLNNFVNPFFQFLWSAYLSSKSNKTTTF